MSARKLNEVKVAAKMLRDEMIIDAQFNDAQIWRSAAEWRGELLVDILDVLADASDVAPELRTIRSLITDGVFPDEVYEDGEP